MPLDGSSINAINTPQSSIPHQLESFTLYAPPSTDLHRRIPVTDVVTAPILYVSPSHPFTAAEVTVSAKWELEWDQAGLVVFAGDVSRRASQVTIVPEDPLHPPALDGGVRDENVEDQAPPAYSPPARLSKWVKASLEFTNNALHATSVSATSDGADLSIAPLPPPYYNTHEIPSHSFGFPNSMSPWSSGYPDHDESPTDNFHLLTSSHYPSHMRETLAEVSPGRIDLRLKLERIGYALWVWYEDPSPAAYSQGLTWKKLREISGFFWGVEDKQIKVGVTASRPANFGMSVWEREHSVLRYAAQDPADHVESPDDGDGDHTTSRGLLVHFADFEVW